MPKSTFNGPGVEWGDKTDACWHPNQVLKQMESSRLSPRSLCSSSTAAAAPKDTLCLCASTPPCALQAPSSPHPCPHHRRVGAAHAQHTVPISTCERRLSAAVNTQTHTRTPTPFIHARPRGPGTLCTHTYELIRVQTSPHDLPLHTQMIPTHSHRQARDIAPITRRIFGLPAWVRLYSAHASPLPATLRSPPKCCPPTPRHPPVPIQSHPQACVPHHAQFINLLHTHI